MQRTRAIQVAPVKGAAPLAGRQCLAAGAVVCLLLCGFFPQQAFIAWQFPRLLHLTDAGWLTPAVILFRICLLVDAVLLFMLFRKTDRISSLMRHLVSCFRCRSRESLRMRWSRSRSRSRSSNLNAERDGCFEGGSVRPVAVLLVCAAVLRLFRLDTDLWLDELATVLNFAHVPIAETLTTFPSANHHLLNSLLMRAFVWMLGETAFSIRLSAALFGIAGIAAMFYLAKTVTSRGEAFAVALLLTFSYHHIWFSQSARGYAGYLFGTLLGTAFFLRLLKHDTTGNRVGYVAAMLIAFCSHLNTAFVFAAHLIVVLLCSAAPIFCRREGLVVGKGVLQAVLLTGFLTFHSYVLMLPEIIAYVATAARTGVGYAFLSTLFWQVVSRGMSLGPLGLPAVVTAGAIASVGLTSYARQSRVLVLVLTLPLAIGLAVPVALRMGVYPRFFLFALPVGLLFAVRGFHLLAQVASRLLARGVESRRRVSAGLEGALLLVAFVAVAAPLPRYYRLPKQAYRRAVAFVSDHKPREAQLVAGPLAVHGLRYYGKSIREVNSAHQLRTSQEDGNDVWLIYTFPETLQAVHPQLWESITNDFSIVERFEGTVGNGAIFVCRKKPARESKDDEDRRRDVILLSQRKRHPPNRE